MNDAIQTDVLVLIGSGLGGLAAAWEAAKRGCAVTLLIRASNPVDSNTYRAQGEISNSIIGLRNGILTALLILDAADQAHESRGCHYRID